MDNEEIMPTGVWAYNGQSRYARTIEIIEPAKYIIQYKGLNGGFE